MVISGVRIMFMPRFHVLPESLSVLINHHFIGINGTEIVTSGMTAFRPPRADVLELIGGKTSPY
jgi:hypothetical protein